MAPTRVSSTMSPTIATSGVAAALDAGASVPSDSSRNAQSPELLAQHVDEGERVGTTKEVTSDQLLRAAHALPPQAEGLSEDDRVHVQQFLGATHVANVADGLRSVAAAVDPLPASVARSVESAVEAQLAPTIQQLDEIGEPQVTRPRTEDVTP